MGYAFLTAQCYNCKGLFTSNPVRVPSMRDSQGVRQPLCEHCVRSVIREQIAQGIEPFKIPADAYEPVDEREL